MNKIPKAKTLVPDREGIVKALDMLSDALQLDGSESSTEELFVILADAFGPEASESMFDILDDSHADSLCFDMRGPMADSILRAHSNYLEDPLYEK
jgi:hypothetical protein